MPWEKGPAHPCQLWRGEKGTMSKAWWKPLEAGKDEEESPEHLQKETLLC